jgi:hypothetical protein
LRTKLIAWKSKKLESPRMILIVDFRELDIVCFGQASFRSYVNDAQHIAFKLFHFDLVSVHITVYKIIEGIFLFGIDVASTSITTYGER